MNRKEKLYNHCRYLLQERVDKAQKAILAAQEDANSETKSSAGDKYETGRAMAHLDKEMHTKRHAVALSELYRLEAINISETTETVSIGSLITTNIGNYFVAVGLGIVQLEGQVYKVISADSPMGKVLLHQEEDDEIMFRKKQIVIQAID